MLVRKELFPDPVDSDDAYGRALLFFSRTLGQLAEEHGRLGEAVRAKVEDPLASFLATGFSKLDLAGADFRESSKASEKAVLK